MIIVLSYENNIVVNRYYLHILFDVVHQNKIAVYLASRIKIQR
jgi:hypothetical protein